MKKLILTLLALTLLLSGCAAGGPAGAAETTEPGRGTETAETAETAVTAETAAPEVPPLIKTVVFDRGTYQDDLGNEYEYSYELPALDAETPGAVAVNGEIDRLFGGWIREAKADMEDRLGLSVRRVGFRSRLWADVLTLELTAEMDFGVSECRFYCYEISTGRWLSSADVLKLLGVSQEDFLERCRKAFRERFAAQYESLTEAQRQDYGYYEALERCGSERCVNPELMVCPEDGKPVVLAPIPSLDGAEYRWQTIRLD